MLTAIRLRPVKRLIRHSRTGLFLTSTGDWAPQESQAANLDSLGELASLCGESELREAELVLKFGGARYDIAIPVCHEGKRAPTAERVAATV